ncbi:hypothetical protein [Streptomyces sp. N50]|uniref:hypothetical protein n=1 Tax=Streptomyces sp. N50 TaxID=3081765 RepID=UPI002961F389|nr:hypothetical protein [Streptomyces sp. N50]WOX16106.1 hypothetical protein R2B38_45495 [Streptomyces sp. N50]
MTKHEHARPTPPSQAPGESGDPEARDEAEEAVRPRTQDDKSEEDSASGDAEERPSEPSTRTARSDASDA